MATSSGPSPLRYGESGRPDLQGWSERGAFIERPREQKSRGGEDRRATELKIEVARGRPAAWEAALEAAARHEAELAMTFTRYRARAIPHLRTPPSCSGRWRLSHRQGIIHRPRQRATKQRPAPNSERRVPPRLMERGTRAGIQGWVRRRNSQGDREKRAGDKTLRRGRHMADAPEWHTPQPPRVAVGGGERSLRRAGTPDGIGDQRAANDPAGNFLELQLTVGFQMKVPELQAGEHRHIICGRDWVNPRLAITAVYNGR